MLEKQKPIDMVCVAFNCAIAFQLCGNLIHSAAEKLFSLTNNSGGSDERKKPVTLIALLLLLVFFSCEITSMGAFAMRRIEDN